MSKSDEPVTSAGARSAETSQASSQEEKSPPYNLYFAGGAIAVGLIAYVVTIFIFGVKLDSAAVTAALGALFTLIGTISGAYFGIKKSSDTEDKGREAEKAANERQQEAQKVARETAGALESSKWTELKDAGIL
jgi:F0F1-type ATP synthase assembly protein I